MEDVDPSVIAAEAGIHWLQVLRGPCLRRDDGGLLFFGALSRQSAGMRMRYTGGHALPWKKVLDGKLGRW